MKRPELSLSIFALTMVNLLPLVGVLLFDWDAVVLILLYWTENVVVGIYNILKIALAKTLWQNHPKGMAWPILALFISHGVSFVQNYLGGICFLHCLQTDASTL